jgi:hypothetical protein
MTPNEPHWASTTRSKIAAAIVDFARGGERDPRALKQRALKLLDAMVDEQRRRRRR